MKNIKYLLWDCACRTYALELKYPFARVKNDPRKALCRYCGRPFPSQEERNKIAEEQKKLEAKS